jgi:hypothetical protein
MKLTPWFPGRRKPVHVGVYQRQKAIRTGVTFSFWNGARWHVGGSTPEYAASRVARSMYQSLQWRGVLK